MGNAVMTIRGEGNKGRKDQKSTLPFVIKDENVEKGQRGFFLSLSRIFSERGTKSKNNRTDAPSTSDHLVWWGKQCTALDGQEKMIPKEIHTHKKKNRLSCVREKN
jgi:hypothetical protein